MVFTGKLLPNMNSISTSNTNDEDPFSNLAVVGSRISILASDCVDFSPSEYKICPSTSVHSEKSMTTMLSEEEPISSQQKQINCVDLNKNTYSNPYITLNGNKEKSLVNGKDKFILNGCKEKVIEDGIPVPKTLLYSGKIHVEWKQIHKIGAGLNNLGNTCFMNTVIQCLTYCPPLANYLLHDNDHPSKCTITGFCMMCVLQKHMKRAIGKSGDIIKPVDVYQRLKLIAKHFQFGRQEDAHEFLRYVIDNLWKSCLSQNNAYSKLDSASKETTVINQIFGGYHRSQVICLRCKGKSNTFDHFMDFILDIKQNVLSLEKALDKFIQPELLEQDNSYKCPKCKMKVTAQKRFTVYRAPNVATFQLKRFDYNRSFGGKITKQITYPEKLNLRPYMSDPKGDPVWYRLNAVLVHSGPTCNSGHYYCYVKNSNGFWYIMDDQRVHQVSLTQVLNQSAYVLFYIKVSSEGSAAKKSFENGNSFMKTNPSNCNYKKISEIPSLKSSPLTENNQARQSSPKLKQHVYPAINLNKRNGLSPNINREKISFGIRSTTSNTPQDVSKTASSTFSPAKKMKSFQNTSKTDNNNACLVPYIEDSSDSSDENDRHHPKAEGSLQSLNSSVSKSDSAKSSFGNHSFTNLNVKRKSSKLLSNVNRFSSSSTSSLNSTSPKVIATSVWTVTDASAASPGADSNSSLNSVHSTTDWHVTSTNSECSDNSKSLSVVEKQVESESGTLLVLTNGERYLPSETSNKTIPISHENECETVPSKDNGNPLSETPSSSKQCDFREPETECAKSFLVKEESTQKQPHSSFLKRKCSDSDQELSQNSEFHNRESQYSTLSKKAKCASESINSYAKNDLHKQTNHSNRNSGSESSLPCSSPHKNFGQSSRNYSPAKSSFLESEFDGNLNGKIKSDQDRNKTSRCSSNSSLEYEWVEKTKESGGSNHFSSKGNNFEKGDRSRFGNSNSHRKMYRKPDVAKELNRNSQFFYGSNVPTWKGTERHRTSVNLSYEKQTNFDDYEDEFDRGKIRKSRPKDRYHYRKHNPFQKFEERNNYNKHEDRYYYKHHYDKPYNPHHRWRQNSQPHFHRQKFFKRFH